MKKLLSIGVVVLLLLSSTAFGQAFGKNKVQYDNFDWSYIQTEHFDIFFYQGGKDLATFAASVAEQAYRDITSVLNWRMRKRTSLILYNSHNDFQQTNVILEYLTEGTGGFTELFKNRSVVAFEGSYHDFWHVIRHELVHVIVNDMIYGGSIQSVVSGRVTLNIPLWMNEGLAEYLSMGWDTNADMIMRDVALNDNIPSIDALSYYMAYKGGQSVYRFIADKYGIEKIGEVWSQMKGRRSAEKGFKSAIGMDMKELTESWHRWVRTEYWPDIADRDDIEDIAKRLTDHEKLKNYFNTSPAISPNGGMIALLSDRNGYADIYLISAIDGKVLRKVMSGQRTHDLEELKWLHPRLSWSPDSKRIVLAVKSGDVDALIIVNAKTGKKKRYTFDLEEIYTASWSPDGDRIAFIGLKAEQRDLYVYHLKEKHLERLTSDIYSDFEPDWSNDGEKIIFASSRAKSYSQQRADNIEHIFDFDYHQTDLFVYDFKTKEITRLTNTPQNENYPTWSNRENAILYTSDAQGISNFYVMNLDEKTAVPISNVLTGVFQPSISKDDSRLVFAGYSNMGWDIYSLSNPFLMQEQQIEIKPTVFAIQEEKQRQNPEKYKRFKEFSPDDLNASYTYIKSDDKTYTNYVFAPEYESLYSDTVKVDSTAQLSDTTKFKTEKGEYVVNEYKTRFTLDLIDSQAGYSTFWGLQGTNVFAFSDVLGNHRLVFGTELFIDLENSDYYLAYDYLTKRINYSFVAFHAANFYAITLYDIYRLRNYGGGLSVSRPFSKFTRLELGATSYNVQRQLVNVITGQSIPEYELKISTILPHISWIYDNTLWGYFYPIDGWRTRLSFLLSPEYTSSSLDFKTLSLDARRYFKINRDYTFGLRLSAGFSEGKNAQRFFLGGEQNWINQHYRRDHDFESVEDIYFSEFVTPLRGARYYEEEGTRYLLANFEFRYPFIKYMALGWPLPMTIGGIQGVTFLDMGAAWKDNDLHPFGSSIYDSFYFDDLVSGFGFGTRIFLGYFLLKIDVAWRFDFSTVSEPKYYFSLGLDF